MSEFEVRSLLYYPIKSCGPVDAEEAAFSEFGIAYDREWMLVGPKGNFLSQRVHPELALVQTRIEEKRLIASAPHVGELAIPLEYDPEMEPVKVNLWKRPGTGMDQGSDAQEFFSEYLGRDARLLRLRQPRDIRPDCRVAGASERTGFADGFPILIASATSLAALNEELDDPATIDQFRANIVVEGGDAYDEDYWREIQIGGLQAFVVRACARCPVPNVKQGVGVLPKERPVTDALRATRHGIDLVSGDTGDFFGQNAVHVFEPGTTIKVGDGITVVSRADERNWIPL